MNLLTQDYGVIIQNYEIIIFYYEIIIQDYEIIIQDYEIIIQDYENIIQDYEIIIQDYEIIIQDYEIIWGKRTGFASVALDANAPIIPVFTQNIRQVKLYGWDIPFIFVDFLCDTQYRFFLEGYFHFYDLLYKFFFNGFIERLHYEPPHLLR